MADNVTLNAGSGGAVLATDEIAGTPNIHVQRVKLQIGTDGSAADVNATNPVPVNDAGGSLTIDGTVTTNAGVGPWPVTDNGTTLSIDDGAGSITVDGTVTANAQPGIDIGDVTVNNAAGAGAVNVQDGGNSLTIDASSLPLPTGAATGAAQTDGSQKAIARGGAKGATAAADVTSTAEGIDHQAIDVQLYHGGTAKDPTSIRALTSADTVTVTGGAGQTADVKVTLDSETVTVSGTVQAALNAGTNNIGDVDVLTVPAPLSVVGTGTEAAAMRVTIANDSTGLLSVDDNGASLTVDGTVTANAGTGPWPVTDNGGSITIDATSLPLPTGAATETSLVKLTVAQGAALGTNTQAMVGGSVTTANPTYVTGQVSPLSLRTDGALRVGISGIVTTEGRGSAGTPIGGIMTVQTETGGLVEVTGSVGITNGTGAGAVNIQDGGNTITVDGSVTAAQSTATNFKAEVVGPTADNAANPTAKLAVLAGVANAADPTRTESNVVPLRTTLAGDLAVTLAGEAVALAAGTNAIGKLAANSGVDIGDVDILSAPARAATTDTITAKLATDAIQNGTTALTPKFAAISVSTSGNNTIVAAVTGKKIRVLGFALSSNGTVNAKWQSGASGTDLTGLTYMIANSGIVAPFSPVGHFETAASTLLNLNLSAAVAVGGHLIYVEV